MLNFLSKLFGNKSEKDVKAIRPLVAQINVEFAKLSNISDDQLRAKTQEFRARIADYVKETVEEIKANQATVETIEDIQEKEDTYTRIDELKKERNQQLEEVLLKVLPEAFAVVKETARRLKENKQLVVTAEDWDHEISKKKKNVVIEGGKAIWNNQWEAAGNTVTWEMVHYDVQLIGGVVLHQGKISEMGTGEGKTLVSTLPAYLNALTGLGVHIVTVNDYLARRDSEWNGPLFEFHKISVDCIDRHEPNSDARRNAYLANITYGTNNEYGFDYLRDNMTSHPEYLVQRDLHYAIVDEIDSVLIDEARTPLIISGPVPQGEKHEFHALKPRIERLVNQQRKVVNDCLTFAKKNLNSDDKNTAFEAGKQLLRAHRGLPKNGALIKFLSESGTKTDLLKTEAHFLQDKAKQMHVIDDELFFMIEEKNNTIDLTDKGRELITAAGEDPDLFVLPDVGLRLTEIDSDHSLSPEEKVRRKELLSREYAEKSDRLHSIHQLLKAYTLFEVDVDYILDQGKVLIVDEQTGRVLAGRRYSDGLHQAIEAKENVKVEASTQTYATVTLQNFFRMYHKLAGMTGTAETEAGEFYEIYKLDVVVIPTNRPVVRKDSNDYVYKTKREKYKAVIEEIELLRGKGRPILVGTTSVEISELLSRMLTIAKVPHNVLNAKQHQREAEIVQEAGLSGTVTIATNMAGRGTDIKLGPGVKEAGGLAIIGTERHESRRIDRQLRGRAGRQGDPGTSQFYVSLEDELMRLFGSERISKIMDRLGLKEGEVIQHSLITKSITNAQRKVEENNFAMRKRLLEYDDVMNSQRTVVYNRRRNALFGGKIRVDLDNMLRDLSTEIVNSHFDTVDIEALQFNTLRMLAVDPGLSEKELGSMREDDVAHHLYEVASATYARKRTRIADEVFKGLSQIHNQRPEIEFVEIPFTDGMKKMRVVVNIKESLADEGRAVMTTLEKSLMLNIIDDKWKNHLREMDELRTAVQNASLEQKDPLLVYKFESFNLFQEMLKEFNRMVISTLMKAELDLGGQQKEANVPAHRDDFSKLKTRHETNTQIRQQENRNISTNAGSKERVLTRNERREMERKEKKKK
jgi:preprotein translocase subunit SecA